MLCLALFNIFNTSVSLFHVACFMVTIHIIVIFLTLSLSYGCYVNVHIRRPMLCLRSTLLTYLTRKFRSHFSRNGIIPKWLRLCRVWR